MKALIFLMESSAFLNRKGAPFSTSTSISRFESALHNQLQAWIKRIARQNKTIKNMRVLIQTIPQKMRPIAREGQASLSCTNELLLQFHARQELSLASNPPRRGCSGSPRTEITTGGQAPDEIEPLGPRMSGVGESIVSDGVALSMKMSRRALDSQRKGIVGRSAEDVAVERERGERRQVPEMAAATAVVEAS